MSVLLVPCIRGAYHSRPQEPLGLICNRHVTKIRRALRTSMGAHTTIRQQRPAHYSQQKAMEGVQFDKRPAGIRIQRNLKRKADCKQSTFQDSYRFLDPNSKTFSWLFPKTIIFLFSDSRLSNRWSVETLKTKKHSFFSDALQTNGRDWIRFDQNEK